MHTVRILSAIAMAAASLLCSQGPANAQLGMYTLPKDDFTWNWGRDFETSRRAFEDFSVSGGEAGFNCELTGKISPAGRLSQSDIRALENELQMRVDFIYAASQYMNELDYSRNLDWATLECKKFQSAPVDAEERAERENRAREKMLREVERRRERAGRNQSDSQ
jgi:hypothetical protein